jgi:hypothetical protein
MGAPYEFNWYLVVANEDAIMVNDKNTYTTIKSESRIYPIESEIPLIIKKVGCIGIVRIVKFSVDKDSTKIDFKYVMNLNPNDVISKHYYDMYICMKNKTT